MLCPSSRLPHARCLPALRLGLALLLAAVAFPATAAWVPLGPPGGPVSVITVDPTDPQRVYAASVGSGLFRSTNGGESWHPLSSGPRGEVYPAAQLVVDPAEPQTLYLRTTSLQVYKSTDGGVGWREIGSQLPNEGHSAWDLRLDPRDPSRVWIGTFDGPYRSVDGGETFTPTPSFPLDPYSSFPKRLGIQSLVIDPRSPARIYAATPPLGVHRSLDGGATWAPANQGLSSPALSAGALALDPANSDHLVLWTVTGGLYTSTDGAASWQALTPGLPGVVTQLAFSASGQRLYAAVFGQGLFHSANGGHRWQRLDPVENGPFATFSLPRDADGTLFAGSASGPWRSVDDGASWSLAAEGLQAQRISALANLGGDGAGPLLAGTEGGTLWRSPAAGGPWARSFPASGTEADGTAISSLAIDPEDPQTVWATASSRLLRSTDGGRTWQAGPAPHASFGFVFTGIFAVPDGLFLAALELIPFGEDYFILYRSTDGGEHWQAVYSSPYTAVLAVAQDQAGEPIYAGHGDGLLRSDDGGATWVDLSTSLPGANPAVRSIAVLPSAPARVFVALAGSGVLMQRAGGAWVHRDAGLPGPVVSLALDHGSPRALVGVVLGAGAYRSLDRGLSWQRVETPLPGVLGPLAALAGRDLVVGTSAGVQASRAGSCVPAPERLCLAGGRLEARVHWRLGGLEGSGQASPLDGNNGTFSLRNPEHPDLGVKVVDGGPVNGHLWLFYGSLSSAAFTLTVTDLATGTVREFANPAGHLASAADTLAFPSTAGEAPGAPGASNWPPGSTGSVLPLLGGRFGVEVRWREADGALSQGLAIPFSDSAGRLVHRGDELDLLVKMVDGRPVNGRFWFFFATLTSRGFEITVTDHQTGAVRTYRKRAGVLRSRGDIVAF